MLKNLYLKYINKNNSLLLLLLFFGEQKYLHANVTCKAGVPLKVVAPLRVPNISVGTDMPPRTVIYNGTVSHNYSRKEQITCTSDVPEGEPFSFTLWRGILHAPLPKIPGETWFAYESGIPGIGVSIGYGTTIEYPDLLDRTQKIMLQGTQSIDWYEAFAVELIVTGPLQPGSYNLNPNNMPTVKNYIDNASGTNTPGLPITTHITEFAGNITITAATCITPDVNVYLGTYDANNAFSDVGSTTEWIDTNLNLEGCPRFFGYYDQFRRIAIYNKGNPLPPDGYWDRLAYNNKIGLTLVPNSTIIDYLKGIISLDGEQSNSATGIGIQLGWGESNPLPLNLTNETLMDLPKDGSSRIKVPLFARYIQTDKNIKPGRANAKVTYTINYY